jgi:hypothetical protein
MSGGSSFKKSSLVICAVLWVGIRHTPSHYNGIQLAMVGLAYYYQDHGNEHTTYAQSFIVLLFYYYQSSTIQDVDSGDCPILSDGAD